jgi:hypothetical protein
VYLRVLALFYGIENRLWIFVIGLVVGQTISLQDIKVRVSIISKIN